MPNRKIFGLDISDHSIEALVLSKPFFGKPRVKAYARTVLRGEVVKDGVIKKPEKLAENIARLLASAEPKPIKIKDGILSLPESQVFTAIFKFPAGLKTSEIKNTISYKAEEVIPFRSSEIYYDFKKIGEQDKTQEIFYVAVPKPVVDSYLAVLKSLGLQAVALDLESISSARALFETGKKANDAKLLIDLGARTTNLNIFDGRGVRQSLTLRIAGDRFTKAIAKNLKLAEIEAERLKMKNGFNGEIYEGRVLLILQNEFKRIIAEAKKLIDFFQAEGQKKIETAVLIGGSALLPKVDQYLGENLGLKIRLGNPLDKIADPKKFLKFKNKSVIFTNVIGLALRGLAKDPENCDINLMPVKYKKIELLPAKTEKKAWREIYFRLAILAVLILLLGLLFLLRQRGWDLYQRLFAPPVYRTEMNSNFDFYQLEKFREELTKPTETLTPTSTPQTATSTSAEPAAPVKTAKILPTGLGYVNVRLGPATSFDKITKVYPGKIYPIVSEKNDWVEIQLTADSAGWVSGVYVDKSE